MCQGGGVELFDGSRTEGHRLAEPDSAFHRFCSALDPNKCFISALIPEDADRHVFFAARDVASSIGIHMQSTVDTPERHRSLWQRYQEMKQLGGSDE